MEEADGERKDGGMDGSGRAGSPEAAVAANGHDEAEVDAAMSEQEASTATEQGKRAASEEHKEEAPQPKRKRFFDTAADSDYGEEDDDNVKPVPAPAAPPAAAPVAPAKGKQAQRAPANVEILEIDDDDSDNGDMQLDGGSGNDDEDRKPVASSSKVKLESRTTPEAPPKARVPRNGKDFDGEKYFGCGSHLPHHVLVAARQHSFLTPGWPEIVLRHHSFQRFRLCDHVIQGERLQDLERRRYRTARSLSRHAEEAGRGSRHFEHEGPGHEHDCPVPQLERPGDWEDHRR